MQNFPPDIDELIGRCLCGEATPEEIANLEAWAAENPQHAAYFRQMKEIISAISFSPEFKVDANAAWNKVKPQLSSGGRVRKLSLQWKATAIAATIILIAGILYWGIPSQKVIYSNVSGETQHTLPDGSRIILSVNSRIEYSQNRKGRLVKLKGNATFTVQHDAAQSFRVEVNNITVTDIGTVFAVHSGDDSVEVMVTEGEVLLDDGKNKLTVIAGHGAVYNAKDGFRAFKISERGNTTPPLRLQFTNAPLNDVAAMLAESFHVKIRVEPAVSRCALTADFTGEDLDTILELIAETMQVKVTKEDAEIVISGNACL